MDGVALPIALPVAADACVLSGPVAAHILQHQALVRYGNAFGRIVDQLLALQGSERETEKKRKMMQRNESKCVWRNCLSIANVSYKSC